MKSEENKKYRIYAFEYRIIPFVAADALVKDKAVPSSVTGYPSGSVVVPPELRPTDTSGFYDIATQENRFSPPVETEGRSYFKLVSLIHSAAARSRFTPFRKSRFLVRWHSREISLLYIFLSPYLLFFIFSRFHWFSYRLLDREAKNSY